MAPFATWHMPSRPAPQPRRGKQAHLNGSHNACLGCLAGRPHVQQDPPICQHALDVLGLHVPHLHAHMRMRMRTQEC